MPVELCISGASVPFGQLGTALLSFSVHLLLSCNMVLKKVEFEAVHELWIWTCHPDNH